VTQRTFKREVLRSEQPVIVDFWAPWCGPCRAVAPVLDEIATERADELKVVKVNVDRDPQLALEYGVQGIPAIILFSEGAPVAGTVGAKRKRDLEKALGLARRPPEDGSGGGLLARLLGRS
ncbi:MAG: thioredoxin, partial [Gaiellales bacterium]